MGNTHVTCFFFSLIVPSFALPFSIRSSVQHGNNLSGSVSMGIVIAIVVIFIIPLLWCIYRLGTRTRQNPRPIYFIPTPIFPTTPSYNGHSNLPSSGQIARPHPVHKKVSRPTSRA